MNAKEKTINAIEVSKRVIQQSELFLTKSENANSPAEQSFNLGMSAYLTNQYDSALTFFQQSYSISNDEQSIIRIALCAWRTKNYSLALEWVEKAIQLNRNGKFKAYVYQTEGSFLGLYSEILYQLGRLENSLLIAEEALSISSEDLLALKSKSNCYRSQNRLNESIELLKLASNNAPTSIKIELSNEINLLNDLNNSGIELNIDLTNKLRMNEAWPD